MTVRRFTALLALPVPLLVAAWALGGAVFAQPPPDLGDVVVVRPAGGMPPPAVRPSGISPETGDPSTADPTRPASTSVTTTPGPPTRSAAPTGADRVPSGPAPTAGDDDDDGETDDSVDIDESTDDDQDGRADDDDDGDR